MGRYRKRPIEINAIQFTGTPENLQEIYDTFGHEGVSLIRRENIPVILAVRTTHGDEAFVRRGDWITPDASPNTFYPIRDDVFNLTYDKVDA